MLSKPLIVVELAQQVVATKFIKQRKKIDSEKKIEDFLAKKATLIALEK